MRDLDRYLETAPAPPTVPLRIARMTEDPDASVPQVAAVAETDPLISAKLVSVANSAMFGSKVKLDTVSKAISRLGLYETRKCALTIALLRTYSKEEAFDLPTFWTFSLASGMAAERLARSMGFPVPAKAYLAALVHRIGDPIIEMSCPGSMEAAADLAIRTGCAWDEATLETGGVPATVLSAALLERWDFPAELVEAIQSLSQPSEDEPLPWIVFCAAGIASTLGLAPFEVGAGQTDWIARVPEKLCEALPAPGEEALDDLRERWELLNQAHAIVAEVCG